MNFQRVPGSASVVHSDPNRMASIDHVQVASLMLREQQRFLNDRPKSKALFERAGKSLLAGVPMNWMRKWPGAFPPFVREALGAHFYDVDGHRYVDLCLGDTGAMTGHSPFATVKAVEEQLRRGNIGPPVDPAVTTKVIEFNDLPALEHALADGEVACVLAEPVMTNVGIVHPEPEFHAGMRKLTRKYGTLLILDETHTICAGPGGYTRAENLEPDILVFGKPIGGGVPGAVYGFTEKVATKISEWENL